MISSINGIYKVFLGTGAKMKKRTLFKSMLAVGALTGLGASATANAKQSAPRKPKALQAGMTVGLVAPASNALENRDIEFSIELLQSFGYKVSAAKHLYQRTQYLAGTDQQRAADLNGMYSDRSVDAIFCLRGGYGSARLLPLLDYAQIAKHPKILLGYSDITAVLNAIYQRTGQITFHGPMVSQNFTEYSLREYRKVLVIGEAPTLLASAPKFETSAGRVEHRNRVTHIRGGRAKGRLLGGNLTLLCHLLGTPFEPDFRDKILFLEEIGEVPYRIDRMLTQLWLAGKLQQLAGLVFGKFTDAEASANSFSLEEVIRARCENLDIPVVRGLMIGHVDDQAVIPIGAMAELDGDSGTLTLLEAAVVR